MDSKYMTIANRMEASGFDIDIDGDGFHIEILDYPNTSIFLRITDPNKDFGGIEDLRGSLSVEAEDKDLAGYARERISKRLQALGILVDQED